MIALIISLFISSASAADLTYTKDARPIFQNRCMLCHNENFYSNNWMVYEDAYAKRDRIKLRMQNKTMPMGSDMPQKERDILIKWVEQGAKK